MSAYPTDPNESERLAMLHALGILDTPPEEDYDELVQLASNLCDVPMSLVSLIDSDRQWFKSKIGIDSEETPRDLSFCTHCILGDDILEISDATLDDRFKDNPLVVGEPNVRFYAGAPIKVAGSTPIGAVCVVDSKPRTLTPGQRQALKTISRQVSTLMQLRLTNKALEQRKNEALVANESLQQLFRIISHDLRSPFQGFLGLTESLEENYDSFTADDIRSYLGMLADSASETYNLLENLLEWSTLEAGSRSFNPSTVQSSEMVAKSIRILTTTAQKKRIALEVTIPEEAVIEVDTKMISSVIRNLTFNAIKFTPEEGRVRINAEPVDGRMEFSISDTGVGLDSEQIANILQRQDIESSAGTGGEHGSGIGLHLVHNFLEKHGTHLRIESDPGLGTTVRFSLPPG